MALLNKNLRYTVTQRSLLKITFVNGLEQNGRALRSKRLTLRKGWSHVCSRAEDPKVWLAQLSPLLVLIVQPEAQDL